MVLNVVTQFFSLLYLVLRMVFPQTAGSWFNTQTWFFVWCMSNSSTATEVLLMPERIAATLLSRTPGPPPRCPQIWGAAVLIGGLGCVVAGGFVGATVGLGAWVVGEDDGLADADGDADAVSDGSEAAGSSAAAAVTFSSSCGVAVADEEADGEGAGVATSSAIAGKV